MGSVRILLEGEKATLGRFAVAPDVQGLGLGTQLMIAVAGALPEGTEEIWVFTSQDSVQNIALYNKHGYSHEFDQRTGDLTYAYLRKIIGETAG